MSETTRNQAVEFAQDFEDPSILVDASGIEDDTVHSAAVAQGFVAKKMWAGTARVGTSSTPVTHGLRSLPSFVSVVPSDDARVWVEGIGPDTIMLRASSMVTVRIYLASQ